MKLYFATRAEAEARAQALHEWLIANNPDYAASVAAGQTLRWAIPAQDVGADGKPDATDWYIVTKDRCELALTTTEKTALVMHDKRSDGTPVKTVTTESVKAPVAGTK